MTSLGRLAALTVVGIAATIAATLPAQAAAPILIKSCTVVKPKPLSHMAGGTHIVYVNLGKKTAAEITFVVGYRNASQHYLRRVQDVGVVRARRDDRPRAQPVQRRNLCRRANDELPPGPGEVGGRHRLDCAFALIKAI